ncbi:PQQ-binding-like beta-propeller repeat protein [Armatimonas rosea]|uniref:Outer membrane protein assembly factor BamB n=1 Tax=Armatimonas rosea TaxID=685828 RepID=A0A7W9SR16_ARMRO|nr:PQQ-binding-like beta-propeller repeat protein [Armatimonas rosea]MBB6051217.1 outer membrane protein assembly factor BamB [Armatimonas rosea]
MATIHWPQFRGPGASGIAEGSKLPTVWNVEEKKNVLFKTPLPGLGHSSPIIWGDKVFVTTAVSPKNNNLKVGLYGDIEPVADDSEHQWQVHCLHKRTGKILWQQTACKGVPKIARHPKSTQASATMATDGKRVLAFFGSEGLYCYDLAGKLLWKRDFGILDSGYYMVATAQWGWASSPIFAGDKIIVQCDVQKGSFLAALDPATGKDVWRTPRNDVPTWSTPTLCTVGGKPQIVCNGWKHIGGYDLKTGKSLWKLTGGGDIPVPTPIVGQGLIFITNAHGRQAPIYAIRPSATGELILPPEGMGSLHFGWGVLRGGAYMQTPLVVGEHLYVCNDAGILSCYDATSGQRLYQERMGTGRTGFTASAVSADGKLYYTSEEGEIFVVQAGPKFKLLAQNPMGEVCMATPAISENALYFHTQGHLVGIAG